MASIAEYFTLRDATATATRIPEPARKEIASALSLGRQKAEGAEALWSNGHAAEGLRLAVEAFRATLAAAPSFGRSAGTAIPAKPVPAPVVVPEPEKTEAELEAGAIEKSSGETAEVGTSEVGSEVERADAGEAERADAALEPAAPIEPGIAAATGAEPVAPTWREVLASRGLAKDKLASIEEAERKARDTALPALDADVSPAHSDLYQLMTRARAEVDRTLAYAAMSPRDLAWTRVARIATASVLSLLVIVALYFVLRTPTAITAEASETFGNSPTFQPSNIVDGNPATEWLLGDRQTGWVEARLSPPRHVSSVSLTNARNAPHFDRATREYRVEYYSGGRMVRSVDGEFASYERDPQPVTVEGGVDAVDRVRFVVRSFHNQGAGLAELAIEE